MKTFLTFAKIAAIAYTCLCILLYFMQERLIFLPKKLAASHVFEFDTPFEELSIKTADNQQLSGLLFKADSARGLIFYLHGNAGSLQSWGQIASTYTSLHYDLFMLDYRGYGKSGGSITSEKQFYDDIQLAYDSLQKRYNENKIIVLGYSIGTGAATKLAAGNKPRLLILQAPYYNLSDLVRRNFRIIPPFLLKYKFGINKLLPACKMPVVIFHGDKDEVIYYGSSLQLKKLFKPADLLVTLHGQGHNGITDNPDYLIALEKIVNR